MDYTIDGVTYKVEIVKKRTNKRTYIRIKDNNIIYVTTNIFVPNFEIKRLLKKSEKSIKRMLEDTKKRNKWNDTFMYLGTEYEIVNTDGNKIYLEENKVFVGSSSNIDNFYKKEAKELFLERLNYWYNNFSRSIPKPSLTIRKMKTRWGVCNTKDKKITLNLELMKHNIDCLDYVINHELAHLIYPNHSKEYWKLVEENYPNYKEVRKKMRTYEE